MRVAAIVAAGGRGARLGAGVPKQLLTVGGESILRRSVRLFAEHERIDEIVVVLPPDLAADVPEDLAVPGKPLRVVAGGARRQDSVRYGFDAVRGRADIVVIHDAACPFASADLITRTIDAAVECGAALAALRASDTVKLTGAGKGAGPVVVERTLPRERVFLAQTPQAFRAEVLAAALEAGRGGPVATDEAAGLTFRNTSIAIWAGTQAIAGAKGLTVKRCRFEDVGMGVFTNSSASSDFYIADSAFIGRNDPRHLTGWTGPFWQQFEHVEGQEFPPVMKSYTAIRLYGPGHVVAHNYVAHFHDGIDTDV